MDNAVSHRFVLASGSPRRRQLLGMMGLAFAVDAADIDERVEEGESPAAMAARLSLAKAEAVVAAHPQALIIAADTAVILGAEVLGKPADAAEAVAMLTRLRARRHWVYTGLALRDPAQGRQSVLVAMTPVLMRDYADEEIHRYVATGDPMDKAGAYAIQHAAFDPVARIEGCYTNVMGLPLCHLYHALREWELATPRHPLGSCPLAVAQGCVWAASILGVDESAPEPADI
jgi:MAF protein